MGRAVAEADGRIDAQAPGRSTPPAPTVLAISFADQVKGAVIWRSGSQLAGQLIAWASTFLVIRLLEPSDYGLVAMTGVVLTFLNLLNGWGFASALVRDERLEPHRIRQAFGMLLLLNGALAAIQFAAAPLAAGYFHQPLVADLLRAQALFYLATPFTALGNALLIRRMDFRRQSQINLAAAVLSAVAALACAYAGLGVWTLVIAPGVLWFAQAIGFALAAPLRLWPSFAFRDAGAMARYGGAMILVQFFWFVQSQADVFIAGRLLDAHTLGLYTTALFLTQIVAAKFVPPLNEIAFAAYARIQDSPAAVAAAFLKSVRLIMLVVLPFYLGLAVTAEPLVLTVLGAKWAQLIPLVPVLACAMPLMTLQILFAPATNALGRPALAVRTGLIGALAMAAAFLVAPLARQRLFAHVDHQAVEVRIRIQQRQLPRLAREQQFVVRGAVLDRASHESRELRVSRRTAVGQPHAFRLQLLARELAADEHQGRQPEFDLVPIVLAPHAGVTHGHADPPAPDHLLRHTFVDDGSEARTARQRVDQRVRRCQHVVEQPGAPRIELQRQVHAQHVVIHGLRDPVQEIDLAAHRQSRACVREVLGPQSGLAQQRAQRKTVGARLRIREPRRHAHGARHVA
jgi:O-antigen/teichoic acid export membrane protein